MDRELLWTSNVDGTRNVAECCRTWNIPRLIFLSSNCLWGDDRGYPIAEGEQPKPIELYGESKWEGEKILEEYSRDIHVIIFRC
jgi:UDP-glucose 4-epimerase